MIKPIKRKKRSKLKAALLSPVVAISSSLVGVLLYRSNKTGKEKATRKTNQYNDCERK